MLFCSHAAQVERWEQAVNQLVLLCTFVLAGCGTSAEMPDELVGNGLPPAPWDSIVGQINEPHVEIGGSDELSGVTGGLLLPEGRVPGSRTVAYLSQLLVDTRCNVWLGEYRGAGYPARRWLVLDSAGEFRGSVIAPPDYTLMDIDDERVLVKRSDSLGQQRVYLATLRFLR